MVEKRESPTISAISVVGIIVGLLKLYYDVFLIVWSLSRTRSYTTYIGYAIMIIFSMLLLLSAIKILKRKNWARALFVFLLALLVMGDISQYVLANSTGSLPFFVEIIVFVFSTFSKPVIPFLSYSANRFLSVFIYAYVIFAIFYLMRPKVKGQFQ